MGSQQINFTMFLQAAFSVAVLSAAALAAPPSYNPKPRFVSTDGTKFSLNGKQFFFAGSNAYYLPFDNVSPLSIGCLGVLC